MLTDAELSTLSQQAQTNISPSAMRLACLLHLGELRFLSHKTDDKALLDRFYDLATQCVQAYAAQHGVDWAGVEAGLQALQRAGTVAGYLHSIPD